MVKIVVDSDVFIDFLRNGSGDLPKLLALQEKGEIELYLSVITVLEIFVGQSSKKMESFIKELLSKFNVTPLDQDLAKICGEAKRDGKLLNTAISDLIIGQTAAYLGAKLATSNKKHFSSFPKLKFF